MKKLLIVTSMFHIKQGYTKLDLWASRNFRTAKEGKGWPISHAKDWQLIHEYLSEIDVNWIWNPSDCPTYRSALDAAEVMAVGSV